MYAVLHRKKVQFRTSAAFHIVYINVHIMYENVHYPQPIMYITYKKNVH